MSDVVKKLLDLQELNITLKETEIVHGAKDSSNAQGLRDRASALRDEIGPEFLARFDRLSRQGLAVVKIQHDTCLGCNIGIARGDINRMIAGKMEPICPHCGKFLMVQE